MEGFGLTRRCKLTRRPNGRFGVSLVQQYISVQSRSLEGGQLSLVVMPTQEEVPHVCNGTAVRGCDQSSYAGRRVDEDFVPLISQLPGFVAYYWVDAGGGVMVSTSVFQDQASAQESNSKAADWVRQNNLASLYPNPPQITAGEVVSYKAK